MAVFMIARLQLVKLICRAQAIGAAESTQVNGEHHYYGKPGQCLDHHADEIVRTLLLKSFSHNEESALLWFAP